MTGELVGSVLGRYRLVEDIGAGGPGEVYRAHDETLDRFVAVRILPEEIAADPERFAGVRREARAAAALDHPNILAVHELGIYRGRPFIVTELLEGRPLSELIAPRALAGRAVVEVAVQIANGLAAAHEHGIVHRNLKPENFFLASDGTVKILDFGLTAQPAPAAPTAPTASSSVPARSATEPPATSGGALVGSASHMSPEQVRGRAVDARSDIFSFGVVLYEMLTGLSPFRRVTPADTVSAVLTEDPPPVSATTSRVNAAFDGIVRRCLAKRPDDRFQSARDVALALQAVVEAPDPAPRGREGPRFGYRWLAVAALIAAAALAFALLVAGYRVLLEREVKPPDSDGSPPRVGALQGRRARLTRPRRPS